MKRTLFKRGVAWALGLAIFGQAAAHDIWIEISQEFVRPGDMVTLSLMLGNHGNNHRDFRLASKIPAGDQSLRVLGPKGNWIDLTPNLIDNGYEPKEGFWSAPFVAQDKGIYQVASTFDQVMSYAPVRDIKCAKSYFAVAGSLDRPQRDDRGFARPVGSAFELIPVSNPIYGVGAGSVFAVKLLFRGKLLAGEVVSFIPKGVTLKGDLDPRYEVKTDRQGVAKLTLSQAGQWLIAAHVHDLTQSGEGYKSINYSATIHLLVPTTCPCCQEIKK